MENNYRVRSFELGQHWFGDDARAQTAKLLGLASIENRHLLLHYAENGKTQQGFAPVKFLARKNGFAVLGYGEEGMGLVDDFSGAIATAWACHLRRPVPQSTVSGRCKAQPLPYMLASKVTHLMFQKKPEHTAALKSNPTAYLARLLRRGFQCQADYLGLVLPNGFAVDVLDWRQTGAHALGGRAYGAVGDVIFTSNTKFDGIWSLGLMTSHGLGIYQPALERALSLGLKMEAAHVSE